MLAVCLLVVVAGVSVAVLSSAGGQAGHIADASNGQRATKAVPAQRTAPTPATSGRATTAPEVTNQGIARTALLWPPGLKHQIAHWKSGPGGAALSAATLQLGSTMQAAGVKLYATMRLACASLASEIETAQSGPPIPYASMQQLYARGLAGLSGAAADCRSAISVRPDGDESTQSYVNKALLSRSLAEFSTGSKEVYRATAEIRALRD